MIFLSAPPTMMDDSMTPFLTTGSDHGNNR